jgi:hypothetical protein
VRAASSPSVGSAAGSSIDAWVLRSKRGGCGLRLTGLGSALRTAAVVPTMTRTLTATGTKKTAQGGKFSKPNAEDAEVDCSMPLSPKKGRFHPVRGEPSPGKSPLFPYRVAPPSPSTNSRFSRKPPKDGLGRAAPCGRFLEPNAIAAGGSRPPFPEWLRALPPSGSPQRTSAMMMGGTCRHVMSRDLETPPRAL